jgi:hypothetical protein
MIIYLTKVTHSPTLLSMRTRFNPSSVYGKQPQRAVCFASNPSLSKQVASGLVFCAALRSLSCRSFGCHPKVECFLAAHYGDVPFLIARKPRIHLLVNEIAAGALGRGPRFLICAVEHNSQSAIRTSNLNNFHLFSIKDQFGFSHEVLQ